MTSLWKALSLRPQSSYYSEAVREYYLLFSLNEEFVRIDQKYRQQQQGHTQVPLGNSNLSKTLPANLTTGSTGTPKGTTTVYVSAKTGRQQSVDSLLDQGYQGRKDIEEETQRLRELVQTQGEDIKKLRKQELENKTIIEDLRRRLSGFASKQLTEGNPNFTDLSDKNRPTKIAERFHAVYDEEWTNALEVLSKKPLTKTEDEGIFLLMKIIKEISAFCQEVIKDQTSNIVMNILKPCTPKAVKKENEANKEIVKRLERQILVMRRENGTEPILNLTEKFKEVSKEHIAYQKCPEVVKYIEKCFELLWLMAITDPPMLLKWPERDEKFDTNLYNHYTQKGDTVSFAVWPAVILNDGGPVMHKGYAKPK